MGAPRRVLVVEDDRHFGSQLKELLEFHGREVVVAHTGPEGVEAFKEHRPDFVLMDVMLPGLHGIRVLEMIRGAPGGSDVPAILMSAVYRSEALFHKDMKRLGVLAFLSKPFSLMDLGRQIGRIIDSQEGGRDRVRAVLAEAAASTSLAGIPSVDAAPETGHRAPAAPAQRSDPPRAQPANEDVRAPDPPGVSMSEIPAAMRDGPPGGAARGRGGGAQLAEDRYVHIDTGRRLPRIGDLSAGVYVRLLTTLFHAHSSARLVFDDGGCRRTMYFLNGYPVWVEVSRPDGGLVAFLVRERIVDGSRAADLSRETGKGSNGLRRRLVDLRILDPADLDAALEAWIQAEVRDGLGQQGHYQLELADDFAGSVPVYEVNPIRALWNGLPRYVDPAAVRRELDALHLRELGRTRTFNRLFGYIATTPALRQLGEALLRPQTLGEVRAQFAATADETSLCLWFLVHAGLLALADSPGRSESPEASGAPQRRAPAGRPASPAPAEATAARADAGVRAAAPVTETLIAASPPPEARAGSPGVDSAEAAILQDYVTRIDLDHYGFLCVPEDADSRQIDAAYQSLAPRYRLRNLGVEVQGETRRRAKELLARLVRAYDDLSRPDRRSAYDVLLERQRREGAGAPESSRSWDADSGSSMSSLSSISATMSQVTSSLSSITSGHATVTGSGMDAVSAEGFASLPPLDLGWWPGSDDPAELSRRRARLGHEDGDALVRAHQAMGRSDFQAAAVLLEGLRARFPSDPGVLCELGWCRFALAPRDPRTVEKALEWVELALAFMPDHRAALDTRAHILCATDRVEDAASALRRLLQRVPESGWARQELARRDRDGEQAADKGRGLRRLWGRKK